ncbi:MAG TPA: PQQ-dependent sugar dehydrogenase [Verrucomicrobiae bacterium]|nr:PQQ-dependent sugar dehydrogenase [Verrucomicrobiae bacterium]
MAQTGLPSIALKPAWPNLKFDRPLWMCEAPDGTHRQFVVEQAGRVWILPADRNSAEPKLFLDISDRHPFRDNEEGLLALAFHPQYKTNGKFYIFYSHPSSPKHTILAEMQVSKNDPDKADPATERVLLNVRKENWNHNGGTLLFGPDGYLYLGIGDGGSGYDPRDAGQNLEVLYAKIIRIDVNSKTAGLEYGIPKDNPFVDVSKQAELKADPLDKDAHVTRQEIWAYGVRNPWRMSFDRETGELWLGDVGQDRFEEVDVIKKGGNYGWSAREGFHPLVAEHTVRGSEPIDPIIEYGHNAELAQRSKFPDHSTGISITGGYVYRGKKIPALRGMYLYADFQMGTIWGLRYENGKLTANGELVKGNQSRNIPSFAEDGEGELYVISFDGKIYQIVGAEK